MVAATSPVLVAVAPGTPRCRTSPKMLPRPRPATTVLEAFGRPIPVVEAAVVVRWAVARLGPTQLRPRRLRRRPVGPAAAPVDGSATRTAEVAEAVAADCSAVAEAVAAPSCPVKHLVKRPIPGRRTKIAISVAAEPAEPARRSPKAHPEPPVRLRLPTPVGHRHSLRVDARPLRSWEAGELGHQQDHCGHRGWRRFDQHDAGLSLRSPRCRERDASFAVAALMHGDRAATRNMCGRSSRRRDEIGNSRSR